MVTDVLVEAGALHLDVGGAGGLHLQFQPTNGAGLLPPD